MVLDWAVGNETWAAGNETCAVNTKNYSCGGNSICKGSENGGYFCLCLMVTVGTHTSKMVVKVFFLYNFDIVNYKWQRITFTNYIRIVI